MIMKKWRLIFSILMLTVISSFGKENFINPEIEARIDNLLKQMTLEEKIGQLHQVSGADENFEILLREGRIGSFLNIHGAALSNNIQRIAVEESRLGIPVIFGNDVIHGYRTIFPIPLGSASSWDPELLKKAEHIAAREAAASGTHWTFSPMIDIARDPRWGRIAEGHGEDPYLSSLLTAAKVQGFQGENLADPMTIVSCAKHYVAYGAAEAGRDYNTVDISVKTLREVYLPPFKAAADAGAGTFMAAFNDLNGTPASANHFTLTEILRQEWGFNGFVVSDWNSIGELINHGIAGSRAEAGKQALTAGVDMDMMSFIYSAELKTMVENGELSEKLIDQAVRRILRIKFFLGLFDHPYIDENLEATELLLKDNLQVAREVARKSMVLLKNENQILPLNKNVKTIAVIGRLAASKSDMLGCWACEGRPEEITTVLDGIKNKVAHTKIYYEPGYFFGNNSKNDIEKVLKAVNKSEIVIAVVGESADMSGEAASRTDLNIPEVQLDVIKGILKTGKPTVVLIMSGRPLTFSWLAENAPAILETWFLGTEAGNAIADVLFGDYNPSGKLAVTFPRNLGQVPLYYNHKNTGRPPIETEKFTSRYIDSPFTPLFPFGYGLSYTKFSYRDLQLDTEKMTTSGKITAQVTIKNIGKYTGEETVQLYVRDLVGSLSRPVAELKGFAKITLQPDEEKIVRFKVTANQLGFYDQQMFYVVEAGQFTLRIGSNSVDGLETNFEIVE